MFNADEVSVIVVLDIKGRWPGLSVWLMVGLGAAVLSDEKGVGHGGAINVFIIG